MQTSRWLSLALFVVGAALLIQGLPAGDASAAKVRKKPRGSARSVDTQSGTKKASTRARCVRQRPQRFLIRSNYLVTGKMTPEKLQRRGPALARANRYRTEEYGNIPGVSPDGVKGRSAASFIRGTTFFGHPLRLHRRVIPALACVEKQLKRKCKRDSYQPKAVGGYRNYNSYRGKEVSNHAFGIAIDIDPNRNPCCGCVAPWPDHPKCKMEASSIYDRTAIPRCWVRVFERYGFYWLGKDELQDTMHFEFLGNPDRIAPE